VQLTNFLAISAKDATGCLSLALDKAASPARGWRLPSLLRIPYRGEKACAGNVRQNLHLCAVFELQGQGGEEK
jgi:hypothetical protein